MRVALSPLLRFALVVAGINLMMLMLFLWLRHERLPHTAPITAVHAAQVATLAEALAVARSPTGPPNATLPWVGCDARCEYKYLVISTRITGELDRDADYAVYVQFFNDNARVYVNGHAFGPDWQIGTGAIRRHWPLFASLPGGILDRTDNHVAIIVRGTHNGTQHILMPFWFDRAEVLHKPYRHARWIGALGHQVAALLTLAAALVALAMVIASRRDPVYRWFAVCALGALLMLINGIVPNLGGPTWLRVMAYFAGAFACMCFAPRLADALMDEPPPRFTRALTWFYFVALAFTAALWLMPDVGRLERNVWPGNLLRLLGVVVAPYLLWRCGRYAMVHAEDRFAPWVVGWLVTATLCGAYDALKSSMMFGMWDVSLSAFGCFFLTTAFVFEVARRMRANQRRMQNHVSELEIAVAAREVELRRNFERIGAMQHVETLSEERRRIMQDMHDGVGGQLASMLVLAKDRQIEPARVLEVISDGLADLRLIVDSLSSVDDDLALALGSLRARIAPRLREAGISLDWAIDPNASLSGFGPQAVLQVFRIVQEAINNSIRHGSATRIRIAFARTAELAELRVEDNGIGFDPHALLTQGHGLSGMRARAARCGAELVLSSVKRGGTVVQLLWHTPASA